MSKQAQLDAIEQAIATGVLTFTFDGQTTTYRSLAELRGIRDELKAQLGQTVAPRPAPFCGGYDKGYY